MGNVLDNNLTGMNFFQSGGHGTTAGIQLRGLPKRYSIILLVFWPTIINDPATDKVRNIEKIAVKAVSLWRQRFLTPSDNRNIILSIKTASHFHPGFRLFCALGL